MKEYTTFTKKAEAELSALLRLSKRKPVVLIAIVAFFVIPWLWDLFGVRRVNTRLESENSALRGKLHEVEAEASNLKVELTPFRTAAILRFGGDEKEALKKLAIEIESIKSTLSTERRSIKTFEASVSFIVSGDWGEGMPKPDSLAIFGNFDEYVIITPSGSNDMARIVLNPKRARSSVREDKRYQVDYSAVAAIETFPIGRTTSVLEAFHRIDLALPLVNAKFVGVKKIIVDETVVQFFVNGELWSVVQGQNKLPVDVPQESGFMRVISMAGRNILKSGIQGNAQFGK